MDQSAGRSPSSGLSTRTIIIIASACASVLLVVVALAAWSRKRKRARSSVISSLAASSQSQGPRTVRANPTPSAQPALAGGADWDESLYHVGPLGASKAWVPEADSSSQRPDQYDVVDNGPATYDVVESPREAIGYAIAGPAPGSGAAAVETYAVADQHHLPSSGYDIVEDDAQPLYATAAEPRDARRKATAWSRSSVEAVREEQPPTSFGAQDSANLGDYIELAEELGYGWAAGTALDDTTV